MENIDLYVIKNITEYLYTYEQVCFKFINKNMYKTFTELQIKLKDLSIKNSIPINIILWLINNFKLTKKFQTECCYYLVSNLLSCLSVKKFNYDAYFLNYCLTSNVDDIILNILLDKKCNYNLKTIYTATIKNNTYVVKWCLKNKKLCIDGEEDTFTELKYTLIELACKSKETISSTIKFLIKNNFTVTRHSLFHCIELNNINVFKCIIDIIKYDLSINFTPNELIKYSASYFRLDFMKYIKETYNILLENELINIFIRGYKQIVDNKNLQNKILNCIEWCLTYNINLTDIQKMRLLCMRINV